jgi:hypothetical protein
VRTSMIKNLYYYSRTKKKEDGSKFTKAQNKSFKSTTNISDQTIALSEGSDYMVEDEENDRALSITMSNADKLDFYSKNGKLTEEERAKEVAEIIYKKKVSQMKDMINLMKSKKQLDFGYISFVNFFYKMFSFNLVKCFKIALCCCCVRGKTTKHSSMTARKHKR